MPISGKELPEKVQTRWGEPLLVRKQIETSGYRVILDLKEQIVSLDVIDEPATAILSPTLAPILTGVFPRRKSTWGGAVEFDGRPVETSEYKTSPAKFVSASALIAKAKQFDDGLYATVELALQQGSLSYSGKSYMLGTIIKALVQNLPPAVSPAVSDPYIIMLAAGTFEGRTPALPPAWKAAVESFLYTFLQDESKSKPMGIYTWTSDLENLYKQDRVLQTPHAPNYGTDNLRRFIESEPKLKRTYEHYLKMMSRMTNPLALNHYLDYPFDPSVTTRTADGKVAFFPHSNSREEDLMRRMFGNQVIPHGFDLLNELIERLKSGQLNFTPKRDSGWYDYQTWALEPLVVPDKMKESNRLVFEPMYREALIELFKGSMALTRETHVKQLPAVAVGAGIDLRPKINLSPSLTVEPLPSLYMRKAISYRFIRTLLEEFFGEQMSAMHRKTQDGAALMNVRAELDSMESLFLGAYVTVCDEIGIPLEDEWGLWSTRQPGEDMDIFLRWTQTAGGDEDLDRDVRMMVPVFFDEGRQQMKVWAFLGWSTKEVEVKFVKPPRVVDYDRLQPMSERERQILEMQARQSGTTTQPIIQTGPTTYTVAYPVAAEVYVNQLMDRAEFQAHCDYYRTTADILENL